MRELAVQAANDTNTFSDRLQLQKEMNRLRQEIDRISGTTEFNTKKLLNGQFEDRGLKFQVGANEGQTVELTFKNMSAEALGVAGVEEIAVIDANGNETSKTIVSLDEAVSVTTSPDAEKAITILNDAIETVSAERSKYGAMQNRLEHTVKNLTVASENLQAAESRIRDADLAKEMTNLSKDQIIAESGSAMLAQANSTPQNILTLIQ
jgi:flagellin